MRSICITARPPFGWPETPTVGRFAMESGAEFRQITDAYLLALALACEGRLVTLDRGISTDVVPGAQKKHLVTLG
jgi:uncharacterized protein